jgi:CheY-like chemotaxis protein
MSNDRLQGRRILVVEDVAILALSFEDILKRAGADVVGPALKLEAAERLAQQEGLSGALLDVRLNGDEIWSVARLLERKGVPFAFCTGHFNGDNLPVEWRAGGQFSSSPQEPRPSLIR